jgi:hypothetical protein
MRPAAGIVLMLCLNAPATAAMFGIENPASTMSNPADGMYNPANQSKNPASNIYNPADRTNSRNPLSPPTKAVRDEPAAKEVAAPQTPARQKTVPPQPKASVPQKNYHFKTVKGYMDAAKKSFAKDDYVEFVSITEDALRRIDAGTLKASPKARQKLIKYKALGYGLLD